MKRVTEYIEDNLKCIDRLNLAEISKYAGYSPWHLYRLFQAYTGMPIMEYIRRRKLLCAAKELSKGRRLFDIAMDYGFETQAGFYKAFQKLFGCSPREYRNYDLLGMKLKQDKALGNLYKGEENMSEQVNIRLINESDTDDMWENIFSQNTIEEIRERITNSVLWYKTGMAVHLVAEKDGKVIGSLLIKKEQHPLYQHIGKLYDFVVNPLFQKMGIARRLFEAMKNYAKDINMSLIVVSCRGETTAEIVYKKLGFTEYGRLPGGIVEPWGERNQFDEVMFYTTV